MSILPKSAEDWSRPPSLSHASTNSGKQQQNSDDFAVILGLDRPEEADFRRKRDVARCKSPAETAKTARGAFVHCSYRDSAPITGVRLEMGQIHQAIERSEITGNGSPRRSVVRPGLNLSSEELDGTDNCIGGFFGSCAGYRASFRTTGISCRAGGQASC